MRIIQLAILGLALETSVIAASPQSPFTDVEVASESPRTLVASRLFRRGDSLQHTKRSDDESGYDGGESSSSRNTSPGDAPAGSNRRNQEQPARAVEDDHSQSPGRQTPVSRPKGGEKPPPNTSEDEGFEVHYVTNSDDDTPKKPLQREPTKEELRVANQGTFRRFIDDAGSFLGVFERPSTRAAVAGTKRKEPPSQRLSPPPKRFEEGDDGNGLPRFPEPDNPKVFILSQQKSFPGTQAPAPAEKVPEEKKKGVDLGDVNQKLGGGAR